MNNEIVTSLWAEKNVTGNSTSSYKGLSPILISDFATDVLLIIDWSMDIYDFCSWLINIINGYRRRVIIPLNGLSLKFI